MTPDDARAWIEYENECAPSPLPECQQVLVAEARRVLARAGGAPWWEYEGIGPDEETT